MQRIITAVLTLLAILIPLFFTAGTFELFEFPKFLLLLTGTIVITVAWTIHAVTTGDRDIYGGTPGSARKVSVGILTVLAAQTAATLTSIHPYTSFWGYYSRYHQGLFTTICYTVIYFAAVKWLDKESTQKLINASIKTSIIIGLIAVLEHYDISLTCMAMTGMAKFQSPENPFIMSTECWGGLTNPLSRSFATLGQPNWLAAYLIPHILFVLYRMRKSTGILQTAYTGSLGIMTLALLFTNSRSGFIAYALSLTTYAFLTYRHSAAIGMKKSMAGAAVLIAIMCTVFGTPFTPPVSSVLRSQLPTETAPAVGTALETVGGTASGDIRKIVWTGALEIVKKYPLLGTGPETFAYTYYWVRPIAHNYTSEWDYLYNKAHNEYLNIAATTGLIGLTAYLFWHYTVFAVSWEKKEAGGKKRRDTDTSWSEIAPAIGAGVVSFTVTNFFGFSVIPVYMIMIITAALPSVIEKDKVEKKKADGLYIGMCLALSAFLTIAIPGKLALADQYFARGKSFSESGKYADAIPLLEKASSLRPQEDLFKSYLGEAYAAGAADTADAGHAIAFADATRTHNPYHLNYYKSRAKVYLTFASADPEFYKPAAAELVKARELAPTDPKLAYNLGLIYSRIGDIANAEKQINEAIELKKNYQEAYYALTLIYEQTGNEQKIPALLQTARENLATYSGVLREKIDKYLD